MDKNSVIPKNKFDMKSVKDKIEECKRRHDEVVNDASMCADEYNQYVETQKELFVSKLQELVFGNGCRHTNVKYDKNLYEETHKNFWVCADCNKQVGKNYWIRNGGGWVTKTEDVLISDVIGKFLQEYPCISTGICDTENDY